ncbi:MAG: hypothetical protein C4539_07355 [Ignavibacteriales bacterium]|nr:MAG: hypothetical protein C4539_07355 [Ignavibacteriales bacterium]
MRYLIRTALFTLLFNIAPATSYAQSFQGNGRIYLSTDRGENWQRADYGFPQEATVNDFGYTDGLYFAGTEADGIYISSDYLRSWHKSNMGLPSGVKVDAVETFGNIVILGTNRHGIFISWDEGKNWHVANEGLTNLTVRCLHLFDPKLFAGTNDGIFVSSDTGKTWVQVYSENQINGITSMDNKVYAGYNHGAIVSDDGGETWKSIIEQSSFHNISNDGMHIFGMLYDPAVLKTEGEGKDWIKSDLGLPNLYTFQIMNIGYRLLAAQWDGIYKSDNNGESWVKSSFGLPVDQPFKELLIINSTIIAGAGMIRK